MVAASCSPGSSCSRRSTPDFSVYVLVRDNSLGMFAYLGINIFKCMFGLAVFFNFLSSDEHLTSIEFMLLSLSFRMVLSRVVILPLYMVADLYQGLDVASKSRSKITTAQNIFWLFAQQYSD